MDQLVDLSYRKQNLTEPGPAQVAPARADHGGASNSAMADALREYDRGDHELDAAQSFGRGDHELNAPLAFGRGDHELNAGQSFGRGDHEFGAAVEHDAAHAAPAQQDPTMWDALLQSH